VSKSEPLGVGTPVVLTCDIRSNPTTYQRPRLIRKGSEGTIIRLSPDLLRVEGRDQNGPWLVVAGYSMVQRKESA
jgi:hypothetical protein